MINSLAAQQQCNTFVEIYFLRFPTIWQIRLTIAYIYYSSIYVKYIGTLLWYAKYYEMMKTLKVKSPCVVCYKLNKNPAISFLLSNSQHVVLSVYLKTKFNRNKQYTITL